MEFNLRKIKSNDIFPMFKILNKVGVNDLKEIFTAEKIGQMTSLLSGSADENATTIIGASVILDVVSILLKNLPNCQTEIYDFLSGLSGLSADEIADLDLSEFAELLVAVVKKEEFVDFFKVVSKLFK
jgi:hypothetical protein